MACFRYTHWIGLLPVSCVLNNLRCVVDIMADEVDIDDEKPEDQTVKKAAKHDSVRATDLEKVTDYVEEAEISSNNISDVRNYSLCCADRHAWCDFPSSV